MFNELIMKMSKMGKNGKFCHRVHCEDTADVRQFNSKVTEAHAKTQNNTEVLINEKMM